MQILDTLAPLFLLILMGAVLRKTGFMTPPLQIGMNRLCYWIALPVLLFIKIGHSPSTGGSALSASIIILLVMSVLILLALPAAMLLRLPARSIGTFVQAAFRGNLAFIGLPVVVFAFDGSPEAGRAGAAAALAIGPVVVAYNVVSVAALLMSRHRIGAASVRQLTVSIISNPLLIACGLGLLWNWGVTGQGAGLPPGLNRAVSLVAQLALPMALLCVGGTLVSVPMRRDIAPALVGSLIKVVAAPLVAIVLARCLHAGPVETAVATIMSAAPTAVASYIMADQLDGHTPMAASTIVISTLLSAASLAAVLAFLKPA
jgi:predicted permease